MAAARTILRAWIVELLNPGLFVSYLFAALSSLIAFALYFSGYSSWIRPFNLGILAALFILHMLAAAGWDLQMAARRKFCTNSPTIDQEKYDGRTFLIGNFILCVSILSAVFFGRELRAAGARRLCDRCKPVLKELDHYRSVHGTYPESLNEIGSFETFTNELSVYLGNPGNEKEIDWNAHMVGYKDISLFVTAESYQCVVPIEKTSLVSFSSFAVYSFTSQSQTWERKRLHWFVGGANID